MNMSIRKFLKEEDGITALEYGILAALVAAALIAVFYPALSGMFTTVFGKITTQLDKIT